MPRANQYLLLYVLDLLSVFARKSDKNLMNAANLAVIFRPGLISHPNHEMSPPEHQLSQQVLEFLIAHQDWFMLEVPPPPQSGPGLHVSAGSSDIEDIMVVPSSDEEYQPEEGWKLVGKPRVQRRQTTLERSGDLSGRPEHTTLHEGDLSPVAESPPPSLEDSGPIGMTRSRTLPSNNRGGRERAKVLRKQKRASSSQPKRSSIDE